MKRSTTVARSILLKYSLLFISILALSVGSVQGQTSATDGTTPASLAPGAPDGAASLSDFEHINLYNGNLSAAFRLLHVAGRGNAQYNMTLPIERRWRAINGAYDPLHDGNFIYYSAPESNWWNGIEPGYGPGVVQTRTVGDQPGNCNPQLYGGGSFNAVVLTRITFTSPDGSETELVDAQTQGAPKILGSCGYTTFSRGKIFVSKDGSSNLTFISDQNIVEDNITYGIGTPSGVLKFPDGTQYRVDDGLVTSLRDRNGNKLTFAYGTNMADALTYQRLLSVTDSLDRQITVSYANNSSIFYDQINFNGFGGASRTIRVHYTSLGQALRAGYALAHYTTLFPEYYLTNLDPNIYNPTVVSALELPDGQSYQFQYNNYAELARVVLPTGGAFEYDHTPTSGVLCYNGQECTMSEVYRRTVARRTYPDASSSVPESVTAYNVTGSGGWDTSLQPLMVDHLTAGGTLLAREQHYFYGNGIPSSLIPVLWSFWREGKEYQTEIVNVVNGTAGAVLRRQTTEWQQRAPVSWCSNVPIGCTADGAPPNDPRSVETVTTLTDVTPNLVTKQSSIDPSTGAVGFDQYNNPTDVWEYDFGAGSPGALLRHTHMDYVTDPGYTDASTGVYIRQLPAQVIIYDGNNNALTKTSFTYDETSFPLLPNGTITGWTDPNTTRRGNPTTISRWLNTNNTWLPSHTQFDQVGNARKIWDPRDTTLINPTQIDYSETYKFAFPTLSTSADPDLTPGANGPGLPQISSSTYDLATGLIISVTDPNNVTTLFDYTDSLDRLKRVIQASNTTAQMQTSINYDNAGHKVTRTSDKDVFNDNVLKVESLFDGLGRTKENRNYEDSTNFIAVQMQYDAAGRAYKSSNPYRQGETPVWTTQEFDALSREISATTPDNAFVTISYSGNSVTVTDQAGKVKKSVQDAAGHTIQVIENPGGLNYDTTYLYDALDKLIRVTQGSQQRFFMFDSLKRLIRARNPEQEILTSLNLSDPNTGNSSWTTSYQYDVAGNLTQKTDPRGVMSTYAYDALNRTTAIDYSDTTPDVKRFYDGATYGKGRLWYAYKGDDSGANSVEKNLIIEYDPLGRSKQQQQLFKLNNVWKPYSISRTYNLAGEVVTQTYPSAHTVSYTYDGAGRTINFSGYLGDGTTQRTYATGINYSVWGSIGREQFGTNTALYHKSFYNVRGQLFDTRLSSVNDTWDWNRGRLILYYSSNHVWGQSGTDNNGNVRFAETWIPPENATLDQADTLIEDSYNYDGANRLSSVAEQRMTQAGGWGSWQQQFGQQYNYDRWGNRTILDSPQTWGTGINKKQFAVDTATNRLGVPNGQSGAMTYDKAGNLTNDTYTGGGLREYDADNKMTRAQGNGQWQEYTYNADGKRVRRKVNGQETWQIYGIDNELLAEYAANGSTNAPQKEYGYRNGELLVTATITAGWGAAPVVNDNPLAVGTTTVQARHITELRDAINAVRSHLGMAAYSWQTSATTNDLINANPIVEMRTALDQTLGPPANGYSAGLAQTQLVKAVHIQELRDRVLAAWVTGTAVDIRWLVTDQLGTPRMVVDLNGSLVNINRHDYLPFGEELVAGVGSRTTSQGYSQSDGVRQHFTGYERDTETSLDYAQARYYASLQGRFTSPDALFANQSAGNPQSWNLYIYGRNNPLVFIDPTGFGDYYYKDGTWSFSDGINDDKVYLLIETIDENKVRNLTPQLLNISHTQFKIIANIVRQESGTADAEENLWIAHTANNEAIANRSTLYNTLQSGFSSAPDKSSGIRTSDSSDRANSARAGVIDVVSGGADPTGGARRWDGTDFLAWGLAGPYGSHAKFRQFASIDIPSDIYSKYEAAQTAKWHGSVPYKVKGVRARYNLPAAVFTDFKNWGGQPCNFHYVTNQKGKKDNLVATGAKGETIFWKF